MKPADATLKKLAAASAAHPHTRRPFQFSLFTLLTLMLGSSFAVYAAKPYWPSVKEYLFPSKPDFVQAVPIEQMNLAPNGLSDPCPGCGRG